MREQLVVDPLGGAPQRQLAQGGEVARREEVAQRPLGLARHVDLALAQPLDQVGGREVDRLDVVGAVEDGIGHGFAHADAGDLRHHGVEALDVLDVQRRVDVDAGREQLGDVAVALGVAAALGVAVGELVDERELRPACEQRVEVHLVEHALAVVDEPARDGLDAGQHRLRLDAAVGLDHPGDDVDALGEAPARRLQHGVGLADARRRAEEDLQLAGARLVGEPVIVRGQGVRLPASTVRRRDAPSPYADIPCRGTHPLAIKTPFFAARCGARHGR